MATLGYKCYSEAKKRNTMGWYNWCLPCRPALSEPCLPERGHCVPGQEHVGGWGSVPIAPVGLGPCALNNLTSVQGDCAPSASFHVGHAAQLQRTCMFSCHAHLGTPFILNPSLPHFLSRCLPFLICLHNCLSNISLFVPPERLSWCCARSRR